MLKQNGGGGGGLYKYCIVHVNFNVPSARHVSAFFPLHIHIHFFCKSKIQPSDLDKKNHFKKKKERKKIKHWKEVCYVRNEKQWPPPSVLFYYLPLVEGLKLVRRGCCGFARKINQTQRLPSGGRGLPYLQSDKSLLCAGCAINKTNISLFSPPSFPYFLWPHWSSLSSPQDPRHPHSSRMHMGGGVCVLNYTVLTWTSHHGGSLPIKMRTTCSLWQS